MQMKILKQRGNGSIFFLSIYGVLFVSYIDGIDNYFYLHFFRQIMIQKSNRKAMNRNWSNQKANPALKTKAGNFLSVTKTF